MRRIFSTVLVLMLVLRGLLGDAMAMGVMPVAMHHQPEPVSAAHADEHHGLHGLEAVQHHDMAMSIASSAVSAAADHCVDEPRMQSCGTSKHTGASCSACDICNSSLHATAELVVSTGDAPQSPQIERATRFVSAQSAQVAKPPIF
ncbi:hypothetical protein [Diaphorobacter caeni]|uniref:hypothetical protein n=1 Tax=Diaphorobacter caeni TaxID=2784387 RepID=UPI001890626B|nr:hypothetical protein [Diaphorobacter caeni]MBF5004602.1 hypothetical protein [Diaphorobacter caeni]